MSACLLIQTIFSRSTRTRRRSIHDVWLCVNKPASVGWGDSRPVASVRCERAAERAAERDDSSPPAVTNQPPCVLQGSPPQCACVRGFLVKGSAKGRHWIIKSLSRLPHIDLLLLPAACTAFNTTLSSLQRELSHFKWKPNTWCLFLNVPPVKQYHKFKTRHILCSITLNWLLKHLHWPLNVMKHKEMKCSTWQRVLGIVLLRRTDTITVVYRVRVTDLSLQQRWIFSYLYANSSKLGLLDFVASLNQI